MPTDPKKLLADAGISPDPDAHDLAELPDHPSFGGAWVRQLHGFLRFYQLGTDPGGVRPSRKFFETLCGFGANGTRLLLDRYCEQTDFPDQLQRELPAILRSIRLADSVGSISWAAQLNDWRPGQLDPDKTRLSMYLDATLNERLRVAAFEQRQSITSFVSDALEERIAKLERKRGAPYVPREPVAVAGADA